MEKAPSQVGAGTPRQVFKGNGGIDSERTRNSDTPEYISVGQAAQ
jgi:hypothetical protein